MVMLTRIDGRPVWINPDNVAYVMEADDNYATLELVDYARTHDIPPTEIGLSGTPVMVYVQEAAEKVALDMRIAGVHLKQ